jgi:alpha-galactosidase
MSLWCMMASPLVATNDVRNMNAEANRMLLNDEMIAIDQDALGKQADKKSANDAWEIFQKTLSNGDYALAVLNRSGATQTTNINFGDLGLEAKYEIRDVWQHKMIGKGKSWKGAVQSHETKVFRLKNISKK